MYLDLYSKDGHRYIRIPNFEQRLKDSFKSCNPLLPELLPYIPKEIPKEIYHLAIHANTNECIGNPKLFATCIFDKILDELGIRSFVGTYKNYDNIKYDALGFFKLALYGRILNPVSKIATVNQNDKYYLPILSGDFYEYNIYDMLDFVAKHKSGIFNRIDLNMRRTFGRTINKIYYDVTNFFFETDYADKYDLLIRKLELSAVSR